MLNSLLSESKRSGRSQLPEVSVCVTKRAGNSSTRFRVKELTSAKDPRRILFTGVHVLAIVNYPDDKQRALLFCRVHGRVHGGESLLASHCPSLFSRAALPKAQPRHRARSSAVLRRERSPGRLSGSASPAGKRTIYPCQPHSPTRTPGACVAIYDPYPRDGAAHKYTSCAHTHFFFPSFLPSYDLPFSLSDSFLKSLTFLTTVEITVKSE